MNYENRIVLFLDILGFRSIIDKTIEKQSDNPKNIGLLYNKLNEIREFLDNRLKENNVFTENNFSLNLTQFSDSIIISFINDDNTTFLNLIKTIQELIIKLANSGILCRGAISYGKLIHNDRIIFGPALNDAYETESKAAMYPRVILDKSIIKSSKTNKKDKDSLPTKLDKDELILDCLSKDTDEKFYIDYFPKKIGVETYFINMQDYLANLRQIIINGSKFQQPDLKVKYGWMKNKYNTLLQLLKGEDKIREISTIPGLFDYIDKLSYLK